MYPLQLQRCCKGVLCTENTGTSWPTHCLSSGLPTSAPPAQSTLGLPSLHPLQLQLSCQGYLRTPESLTCTHFNFSYPVRVSAVQRTLGTFNPQLTSAPRALKGHPLCREPQNTLADTSASAILLKCPLCVETQDTPACIHFSFSSPARALAMWRAQKPHQPASTSALAILPSCMESTRIPWLAPT